MRISLPSSSSPEPHVRQTISFSACACGRALAPPLGRKSENSPSRPGLPAGRLAFFSALAWSSGRLTFLPHIACSMPSDAKCCGTRCEGGACEACGGAVRRGGVGAAAGFGAGHLTVLLYVLIALPLVGAEPLGVASA
eukprot:scaffold64678_cov58-Phaeocystis_antarctica.AAC.2